MIRGRGVMSSIVLGALVLALEGSAADETPLSAKSLAERVQLQAEPSYGFRYNQGSGPYGVPTKPLLERRRAYFPGEKVRLTFKLPADAKVNAAIEARVRLLLTDLDGASVQALDPVPLKATSEGVEGAIEWTVGPAKEGQYFLAAKFEDASGKALATRSEIVTIVPEYPGLLAAAEAAVAKAVAKKAGQSPLVREVSLPSVEMRVEEAKMRFYDFGRAPRDSDFVKASLEAARAEADRLAAGEDPYKDRAGVFTKAYRSAVDDTLQPYALYVPKSYDPAKAYPLLVSLHGATSNHLLNRRRVFGLGNRPGESDYEAIRNDVAYPRRGLHRRRPPTAGARWRATPGSPKATCCGSWTTWPAPTTSTPTACTSPASRWAAAAPGRSAFATPTASLRSRPVCAVANLAMFPWAAAMRAARQGAVRADERHGGGRERGEPAGLHLPRRRGRGGVRRAVAEDGRDLQGPRLARQERPLLRAARGPPLRLGLQLPRRLALRRGSATSAATRSPSASSTRPTPCATTRPTGCASTASTTG